MKANIITSFFCLILLTPLTVTANSTVIHNSVSVSANGGNGEESTIQIKTIHNDEVIEDFYVSTTSPVTYKSIHTENENPKGNSLTSQTNIKTNINTLSTNHQTEQLTLLLNNLLTLLAYYEKLLDK